QNEVAVFQISLERPPARHDPGVKGRERLFEKSQFLEPGVTRRFHCQLARLFVERRWHGQHNFLPLETQLIIARGHRVIPGVAQMSEIMRRGFDGRTGLLRMLRAPGQDLRRAVNRVVAEPGFGRSDLPSGDERALLTREYANDGFRSFFPGQSQTAGSVLFIGEIKERRQRRNRADLSLCDELRNVEYVNGRRIAGYWLLRVNVGDG